MELGAEISQKVKKTIKKQLQSLGSYVDDELPEYIMVMIANKRNRQEMVDDLNLFLSDEADKFVSWLFVILERIQKAMQLPDIDALIEEDNEKDGKKKTKKAKKDSSSESNEHGSDSDDIVNEKDQKRRFKEKKIGHNDNEKEARKRKKERDDSHERRRTAREKRHREMERKEKEDQERLKQKREEERKRREEERKRREEERERRLKEREDREERDKRKEDEKSRRNQSLERRRRDKSLDDSKQHSRSPDTREEIDVNKIRKEAEEEAKRIAKRDEDVNPMDFVKQIAQNINLKLMDDKDTATTHEMEVSLGQDISTNSKDNSKEEFLDNSKVNGNVLENVSLHAVTQYGEKENEHIKEKKGKNGNKNLHSRSRSNSRSRYLDKSRSKSRERGVRHSPYNRRHHSRDRHTRSHNRSDRPGALSRDRHNQKRDGSAEREQRTLKRRHRSHSKSKQRSRSPNKHCSGSRNQHYSTKDERSRDRHRSRSKGRHRSRSREKHRSRSRGRHHSRSKDKHTVSPHMKDNREESRSSPPHDVGTGDLRKFIDTESDDDKKNRLNSKVKVYTNFKRTPSLAKNRQASSLLLKRAVTEAVIEQPVVTNNNNGEIDDGEEDDVEPELDYSENIEDALHQTEGPDIDTSKSHSSDRQVILDDVGDNLATITINVKTTDEKRGNRPILGNYEKSISRHEKKALRRSDRHEAAVSHRPTSEDEDVKLRKGLLKDMSKVDARYAILKSRLDNETRSQSRDLNESLPRTRHKQTKSSDRSLGSMIADLEEKTHKNLWRKENRERKQITQLQRKRDLVRRIGHKDDESSSEDEITKFSRAAELQEETKRTEQRELSRSLAAAEDGDLRNLLQRKERKPSNSDEENDIAQKLREKIKEEKHKRLFGLLNDDEKLRLKQEREELRNKLKKLHSKKAPSQSKERIESRTKEYGRGKSECTKNHDRNHRDSRNMKESSRRHSREKHNLSMKPETKSYPLKDTDVANENDEWIENNGTETVENELKGFPNSEKAQLSADENCTNYLDNHDEEDRIVDEAYNEGEDEEEETIEADSEEGAEVGNLEEREELNEDELENNTQGVENFKDQGENDDDLNNDEKAEHTANNDSSNEVSQDTILSSMHQEDEDASNQESIEKAIEKKQGKKRSLKDEKKSKHKSSKRRRMRHEFIVTLDGLEGGKRLSIQTGTPSRRSNSRSPKHVLTKNPVQKNKSQERNINFTLSDEEFENLLQEKSKQECKITRLSPRKSKRTHRSEPLHRHHHQEERRHTRKHTELSQVDQEILLAEKKLIAQKLLKKTLKQVQTLGTHAYPSIGQRTLKHTTAFVNPHFQRVNVQNTSETTVQLVTCNSETSAILTTSNNVNNDTLVTITTPNSPSSTLIQSPSSDAKQTILSPTSQVMSNSEVSQSPKIIPASPTKVTVSLTPSATLSSRNTMHERCIYWPDCKNVTCPYSHPTTNCKMFPNCSFGDQCVYIHPTCKFGDMCTNNKCIYSHTTVPSSSSYPTQDLCKFGSKCKKMDCIFKHHTLKPCRFGATCKNPDCLFLHDKSNESPRTSQLKWIAKKPHVSERSFSVEDAAVSKTPISIETEKKQEAT